MTFSKEQIEALQAPLSKSHVKQRAQAGRQLSYIEGWHAIDEANRIFGFDAWDRETVELKELGEARQVDGKWRVAYMARVRVTVRSEKQHLTPSGMNMLSTDRIVRDGTGYGSGIDKDLGQSHESAIKEAETDAMKRALMTFGNPFGLALYDKEQKNVVNEPVSTVEVEKGPTDAQVYVSLAKTSINNATTAKELDQWWTDEGDNRKKHGITGGKDRQTGEIVGTPEYLDLVKAFSKAKAELMKEAA